MISKNILSLKPYTPFVSDAKIRLDANENPHSLPGELTERIFEEAKSINLNRYPDHEGKSLKREISRIYGVPESMLVLGNGSDELIVNLIASADGNPKKVMFPTPTFSMYGISAKTFGAQVLEIPLNDDFSLPVDKFIEMVHKETPSIIFISSPNNPTGNSFSEKDLEKIVESLNCLVVIDEAYQDFSSRKSFLKRVLEFENLVVLRTLSKIGLAGLRIGFMASNPHVSKQLEKARLPYNLNTFSQFIATKVLENFGEIQKQINGIKAERDFLMAGLSQIEGLEVFPSDANFILVRCENGRELFNSLLQKGILVRFFDGIPALENCLRITVGKEEENRKFLESLL